MLCGYTLGDYIRMRRLSLAGRELSSKDVLVIDIAIKYGYDTSEGFSRAFTRFHGISPSCAREGGVMLKSFSRLSVKLTLDGGTTLSYRIEDKAAFPMLVTRLHASDKEEDVFEQISCFWNESMMNGSIRELCEHIAKDNIFKDSIAGVSFGMDAVDSTYPYAIGVHYDGSDVDDEHLCVVIIPAHTYAVFSCSGIMPDAFMELYHQVYAEFFATSDYQPCGGVVFEAYPSADVQNPDYACELWVSVEKKSSQN